MYSSFKAIYSVSVINMLKRCNGHFKILFSNILFNAIYFLLAEILFWKLCLQMEKYIFTDIELININST